MRNLSLNQSRVDRLKPRNSTYDIRDTDLKGFGNQGPAFGQEKLLPANATRRTTPLDEDRRCRRFGRSRGPVASTVVVGGHQERAGECPPKVGGYRLRGSRRRGVLLFRRHWKPRTLAVNVNYYENHILPWFKGRPITGITRPEVLEWFESLHAKPGLGEPIPAGAIGHPAAGRGLRIQAGGQQSLQRYQALPPPRAGTLLVAGRDSPRRRGSEPV